MTSWLIVLKYTGGFFAAFYGVYATLTDFRVKRNGKRVLSSKGYFGIGLLTLSAILGLSSDGLKDLKEKLERDEAAKVERISREQAQARDERITARLTDELSRLNDLSASLGLASKKLDSNAKTTTDISSNLETQLRVTGTISHRLSAAVNELSKTSQTTTTVLGETVNRVDSLDVYLEVLVDPWAFTDPSGKSILSSESQRLLEDDKKGKIDLSDEAITKPLTKDLLTHYGDVRNKVLSNWAAGIFFDTPNKAKENNFSFFDFSSLFPDMLAIEQGESGVTGFFISDLSDEVCNFNRKYEGYKAVVCIVKYSIPPNRYIGIRKFTDLNGAQWTVSLVSDGDLLKLAGAILSVGGTLGGPQVEISKEDITSKEKGSYEAKKKIPDDQFRETKTN